MTTPFNEFGPFAVGEICRIVRCDAFPELVGREVMITGPCQSWFSMRADKFYDGYPTDLRYMGTRICPKESHLRRRKPPAADSNERMYVQKWRDMADKAPQRVAIPANKAETVGCQR